MGFGKVASKCPITREEFKKHASELVVEVGGSKLSARPREFSSGSFGYNVNGKVFIEINGKMVKAQVSGNITIVNSKDAE